MDGNVANNAGSGQLNMSDILHLAQLPTLALSLHICYSGYHDRDSQSILLAQGTLHPGPPYSDSLHSCLVGSILRHDLRAISNLYSLTFLGSSPLCPCLLARRIRIQSCQNPSSSRDDRAYPTQSVGKCSKVRVAAHVASND